VSLVAFTPPTVSMSHHTPNPGETSYCNPTASTREEEQIDDRRYIGHLNPESAFLSQSSPATTNSTETDKVGVWLSEKSRTGRPTYLSSLPRKDARSSAIYLPDMITSRLLLPHLEDECLSLLPSSANYHSLQSIYFKNIHPLFPVLDKTGISERR
jgi:hypothetical protein